MRTVSKTWLAAIAAAALACSLVMAFGCSPQQASSGAASSSSATSSSQASASAEVPSDSSASMGNPWSAKASAEEAAKDAGLDAFPLPEGEIADLGAPFEITYSCMQGMAEARFEFPASRVIARTSIPEGPEDTDNSGDYNAYAHEWTVDIDGITVSCAGNREGESTKTYWTANGLNHSLVAEGLGGDADFGLTDDRLRVFVNTMS